MPASITEIKHNLNKPDQIFECNLVRHDGDRIVISYVSPRPYRVCDILIPPLTRTLAYYKEGLPYIVWKMNGPENTLIGYYVHLCDDVWITDETVKYRDLFLDIWFFPDGSYRLLDEDELDEAVAAGLIDKDTATAVRKAALYIIERFPSICASLAPLFNSA